MNFWFWKNKKIFGKDLKQARSLSADSGQSRTFDAFCEIPKNLGFLGFLGKFGNFFFLSKCDFEQNWS
jgi:hypothetical protein